VLLDFSLHRTEVGSQFADGGGIGAHRRET
jgi:hypothetical protein